MSATTGLAIAALTSAAVLLALLIATRQRLRRLEHRCSTLEHEVRGDLAADVAVARADARAATVAARDAARAAGVSDPPPRLAFEPVTGRIVRAVALGAGAGRAIARLARRELRKAS